VIIEVIRRYKNVTASWEYLLVFDKHIKLNPVVPRVGPLGIFIPKVKFLGENSIAYCVF
jgi:hypothetical protein